ncbi:mucin-5AC-like [Esox lucius]|uniref:mucin-5AC-like n=1 Tax=Esox lucius TaxID=8010 RepID=UPI001476999F|nr:mucin-5AC-like [Esox lucius]
MSELRMLEKHVSLLWLDETGNKLKKDSRHQVTQTSDCDITLTLQKEDNNRKWICQLTINEKEISIDFNFMVPGSTASTSGPVSSATTPSSTGTSHQITVSSVKTPTQQQLKTGSTASTSGPASSATTPSSTGTSHQITVSSVKTPTQQQLKTGSTASTSGPVTSATTPSSTGTSHQITVSSVKTPTQQQLKTGSPSTQNIPVVVGTSVGVFVAVSMSVIVTVIILRRRTKIQMAADASLGLNAINHCTPQDNEDRSQPAGSITYASINHVDQNPLQSVVAHGEDALNYASVMPSTETGRETENAADPNSFYSTINAPQGS